jgi:hypothetical protein
MKYDEVKAQKQNYLVFHQKVSLRRNFPGAILQGSLFIPTLPPLCHATMPNQAQSPEHLINLSWTYGDMCAYPH